MEVSGMAPEMDRPFLVGERIYLRPLEVEDVTPEYLQWMNDAALAGFIPAMTFPGTRRAVEEYVRRETANPAVVFLAIIDRAANKHVGNIKFGPIRWVDRRADYAFLVGDPAARGKGYGSGAVGLILDYAFGVLNLHKVGATCLASNQGSLRAGEKCGLAQEAVLKEERFVDGRYEDVIVMGITRERWKSLRAESKI